MSNEREVTPMMRQYQDIKKANPDAILFFRLGDFYEMFFDDAVKASKLLDLTLTKRNGTPMCGVPHHAMENYLARLIKLGQKIAICDQVEDPSQAKGIVRREVTQIVTPGTVVDNRFLDQKANNFLAGIWRDLKSSTAAFAVADVSTAEFSVTRIESANLLSAFSDEIARYQPREIIVGESEAESDLMREIKRRFPDMYVSTLPDWIFDITYARDTLVKHFKTATLKGFGIDDMHEAVSVCGALIHYLSEMQKSVLSHITSVTRYDRGDFMVLDEATQASLELTASIGGGKHERTLLSVIDSTLTGMGSRMLSRRIVQPLFSVVTIEERLNRLGFFRDNDMLRTQVRVQLQSILDIERLCAKLAVGRINPREMVALKRSLFASIETIGLVAREGYDDPAFDTVEEIRTLADLIERAILEEPSMLLNEGNIIRDSYDPTLLKYNEARREGKRWIDELEAAYRTETNIPNLKIRYNNVIGYFIEVTKSHVKNMTDTFIKRQTLVTSERYTTGKLAEYETIITDANTKGNEHEYTLFCSVRDKAKETIPALKKIAQAIASIDVSSALAEVAQVKRFVRPLINEGNVIDIKEGRHPVVEEYLPSGQFVPNDVMLNDGEDRLIIITGPNMSGKSTYLRQTALITLLAQMGSYVPAESATIGMQLDTRYTASGTCE